jgi:hypothetical protein
MPCHAMPLISTQKAAEAALMGQTCRAISISDAPAPATNRPSFVMALTTFTPAQLPLEGMRPSVGMQQAPHTAAWCAVFQDCTVLQHGVPCSKIARCCNMVCRVRRLHGVATWCAVLHGARHAVPALGCDRHRATPAAALWPHTVSILTVANERTAAEWSRVHSTAVIERRSYRCYALQIETGYTGYPTRVLWVLYRLMQ